MTGAVGNPRGNRAGLLAGACQLPLRDNSAVRQVRFSPVVDVYDIEDDGFDHFTFDNVDADGFPAVRQQSRARQTPNYSVEKNIEAELWAHWNAVAWITGGIRDFSSWIPRRLTHNGRIPV